MRTYTLPDVVRKSGASKRQVDHWTSLGYLLSPQAGQGSGTPRFWSEVEVDVARLMVRLSKHAGLSIPSAAKVARAVATTGAERVGLGEGMVLTIAPPEGGYASQRVAGGA